MAKGHAEESQGEVVVRVLDSAGLSQINILHRVVVSLKGQGESTCMYGIPSFLKKWQNRNVINKNRNTKMGTTSRLVYRKFAALLKNPSTWRI